MCITSIFPTVLHFTNGLANFIIHVSQNIIINLTIVSFFLNIFYNYYQNKLIENNRNRNFGRSKSVFTIYDYL